MKTLRQELKERGFEPETRIILEAVQRWLKQNPRPRNVYLEMHRNTMYDRLRAWELWYSKLLEELKEK